MGEFIESGVRRIQIEIRNAKYLMHDDPAAAAKKLEQAEILCEETVEALKTLTKIREIEAATAEIRAETARIEKQTRLIQLLCQDSNRNSGFGCQCGNA